MVRNIIISSQFLVTHRGHEAKNKCRTQWLQTIQMNSTVNNGLQGSFIALHLVALCFLHIEQYSEANLSLLNHLSIYILSIKFQKWIWGLQVRYGQQRPHMLQTQNLLLSRKTFTFPTSTFSIFQIR